MYGTIQGGVRGTTEAGAHCEVDDYGQGDFISKADAFGDARDPNDARGSEGNGVSNADHIDRAGDTRKVAEPDDVSDTDDGSTVEARSV